MMSLGSGHPEGRPEIAEENTRKNEDKRKKDYDKRII